MATKKPDETKYCSFCGKNQHETRRLIAGPSVFICDECIDLCNDIVREEDAQIKVPTNEKLPTPEEIVAKLDLQIIGQHRPKEVLAVAAYQHYKRMAQNGKDKDGVNMEKANVLLIGPTGSGKTLLAATLANILGVPFAAEDLTGVTQAGFVGNDVEGVLTRLYQSAGGDIAKAEFGLVFLDEGDKIARKEGGGAYESINTTGVQHRLLKMLEGMVVEIPTEGGRKNSGTETVKLNTKNILFIVGGAFTDLEKIIAKRLRAGNGTIGFGADIAAGNNTVQPTSRIHEVTSEDLVSFGFDGQLVGRLPNLATLDEHDEETLMRILVEPQNALLRQYAKDIAQEGAALVCDPDAVREIARIAMREKTGARALKTTCGKIFHSTFFNLPTLQKNGRNVVRVHLTAEHVRKKLPPELICGDVGIPPKQ